MALASRTARRDSPTRPTRAIIFRNTATFDLAVGKSIGENTTVSLTAINVANRRVLLDSSLTFGGFHYNDPRQLYAEVRYRFHF